MVLVNIIVWGFIFGGGLFLNWHDLKQAWVRFKERVKSVWYGIASRTYVMVPPKNLIRHVFGFYAWPIWYLCMRPVRRLWNWCKRFWASSIKNPAIMLLVIAWGFIALALWFFGFDIYDIYVELHKQIDEGGKTPEEYRGIAIRYFGIVAGAGAIIGYIFATGRSIISDNQNKINAQAQITESMVQAITQIGAVNDGKPNIEVRLGGLYSLQRIMQNSSYDEKTIAKIIYAYVRENTKRDKTGQPSEEKLWKGVKHKVYKLPEDIQAAFSIINQFNEGRRTRDERFSSDDQLDFLGVDFREYLFTGVNFRYAFLEKANLSGADLTYVDLSDANLHDSNLQNVILYGTDLSGSHLAHIDLSDTILLGADFTDANLRCSKLSGADFRRVGLENVDFKHADLSNAILYGVDLSKTRNLSQEHINSAKGDKETKLPKGLTRPKHWIKKKKPATKKPKNSKKTP